jgi:hypothetical protein
VPTRSNDVVGEEEDVEPRDQIERVVLIRQRLNVADPKVRVRDALAREFEQRLGRVEPASLGPAL